MKKCYRCDKESTSKEHAPAKCFFPVEHRVNLIKVPSCDEHNTATSKDDEYVRGVVVTCIENNDLSYDHWSGMVRDTFKHSSALFFQTFQQQKEDAFFHDRARVDSVMEKIAYALYFYKYKKTWQKMPKPFFKDFFFEDGKSDIEVRLPAYRQIPEIDVFEGSNPQVFKYQFIEGIYNGEEDTILKMVFYEGFSVFVIPFK